MSRRRRRRELTREEMELWRRVTQDVAPQRPAAPAPAPQAPPPAAPAAAAPPARRYEAAGWTPPAPARPAGPAQLHPLGRPLRQQLARGRKPIDAAIDLHGMRQSEAHHALHAFLLRSQAEGARIVLVVTGKGSAPGAAERESGVLRRMTPHWLAAPDWRNLVLGFEAAGRGHGGDGALYVRLRRRDA